MLIRLLNVSLRGSTLVSKFFLVFFLAYFLEPSEVGAYGIFFASVSYSIYFVGAEFYLYSTRELIGSSRLNWGRYLKSHFALTFSLFMLVFPVAVVVLSFDVLTSSAIWWFVPILFLEYVAQEANRLLVAASRQVLASIVLFFRSGLWCLAIVLIMYFDEGFRSLDYVFLSWFIGVAVACIIAGCAVYEMKLGGWRKSIDWDWIKKGLLISSPFLVASLSVRGIFTFDRFFINFFGGSDVLGAYVFFASIANGLVSFLDAALFVFAYPALIHNFQDGDYVSFRTNMKKLFLQTAVLILVFLGVAVFFIDYAIGIINKSAYVDFKGLFYLSLLSTVLFVIGFIPQYGLYAQGHDKPIIVSSAVSFFIFIIFVFLLNKPLGFWVVPYGALLAFAVALAWKAVSYFKLMPRMA